MISSRKVQKLSHFNPDLLDKKEIDEREKSGAAKVNKSELESLILRHIDSEKDKRRKSLGKTFLKSANVSQNDQIGLKHQRTPSHPVTKTSNFLDQFKSSRPQPIDTRAGEIERSRSNSQALTRKKQSLGSQNHYLQISNNSILADGLGDKLAAGNKKSKNDKIQEIRSKFGLNHNRDSHGNQGEKNVKDFLEKKASLLDSLIMVLLTV